MSNQRSRSLADWAGWFACVAGLAVTIGGLAGAWLANWWIAFDILSHFTLHFLLAGLAFGTGLMVRRFRLLTAVCVMVLGLAAISVWPLLFAKNLDTVAAPPGERAVTIMSFNAWVHTDNWQQVAGMIRKADPDIAVVIEFNRPKLPILKALKKQYPYSRHCVGQRERGSNCWLAMLSKYPIVNWDSKPTGRMPAYVRAKFGAELGGLTVVGVHSVRPPQFRVQMLQLNRLNRFVKAIAEPKVVVGDFNSTPYSRMLRSFVDKSGLTRITSLPTWPNLPPLLPQLAIDHIYVSREVRVLSGPVVGDAAGSDHLPVMALISVKQR